MANVTINLPEHVTFTRGGHEMSLSLDNIEPHIIAELVAHGLTQKVGDAAAGKSGDDALNAMQAVYDALQRGEWGRKRAAGTAGLTQEQLDVIAVADDLITAKQWKAAIADWSTMSTPERRAAKWEVLEKHPKLKELKAEAERRRGEAKINITL